MRKIWCFLGFHKFSKWRTIKKGTMEDELERKCKSCGYVDNYKGMTEKCMITGELSPYIMKH